jgi:prepilin-type N-terminal cleavage/methylation domain-containing protein
MPRLRSGFTLIELLVVVVVIGVLAAIAVPRYSNAREKSKASVLISDLRNLATAEEGYFYEHRSYARVVGHGHAAHADGEAVRHLLRQRHPVGPRDGRGNSRLPVMGG